MPAFSGLAFQQPVTCRSLDLLLAIAYQSDEALMRVLEAGIMPVIITVVTAYAESIETASALQPDADSEQDECPSSSDIGKCCHSPSAVLSALSLREVSPFYRECHFLVPCHWLHEILCCW